MTSNPYKTPDSDVSNDAEEEITLAVRLPFRIMAFGLSLGAMFVCYKLFFNLITYKNFYTLIALIPLVYVTYLLLRVTIMGAPKLATKRKESD